MVFQSDTRGSAVARSSRKRAPMARNNPLRSHRLSLLTRQKAAWRSGPSPHELFCGWNRPNWPGTPRHSALLTPSRVSILSRTSPTKS